MYTILDALADNYVPTLNALDHRIDETEDEIFNDTPAVLNKIVDIRNDIIYLRKIIRPQRNTVNQLARRDLSFLLNKRKSSFIFVIFMISCIVSVSKMMGFVIWLVVSLIHIFRLCQIR